MVSYITLSPANVMDEKAFIHQSTLRPSVLVGFWFGHEMKEEVVRSGLAGWSHSDSPTLDLILSPSLWQPMLGTSFLHIHYIQIALKQKNIEKN